MGNKVNIRPATPDDALALATVLIDSWRMAYRGLVPDSHLDNLDYNARAARFRDALAAGSEDTYVAEGDGEILGLLTLGGCQDTDVNHQITGEIRRLYVAPQHWRKGVGSRLCQHAEEILRRRGYAEAKVWVFDGNRQGRRFYEAMGFDPDGASMMLERGALLKAVRYARTIGGAERGTPPGRAS